MSSQGHHCPFASPRAGPGSQVTAAMRQASSQTLRMQPQALQPADRLLGAPPRRTATEFPVRPRAWQGLRPRGGQTQPQTGPRDPITTPRSPWLPPQHSPGPWKLPPTGEPQERAHVDCSPDLDTQRSQPPFPSAPEVPSDPDRACRRIVKCGHQRSQQKAQAGWRGPRVAPRWLVGPPVQTGPHGEGTGASRQSSRTLNMTPAKHKGSQGPKMEDFSHKIQ